MGCAGSKHEGNEALFLCKERVRFIKQAMDSRYALSAAQLSYTQSLRSVGVALRQFAECETSVESSLSTSDPDKSPSHSSYASPSPSGIAEHVGSPRNSGSPLSPQFSNISYMRATATSTLNFTVHSSSNHFVEEESISFPFPPPPPPDTGFSWDFFDPVDGSGNSKVPNGGSGINQNFSRLVGLDHVKEEGMAPIIEEDERSFQSEEFRFSKANSVGTTCGKDTSVNLNSTDGNGLERPAELVNGSIPNTEKGNGNEYVETLSRVASTELSGSKRGKDELIKGLSTASEDAPKIIAHRTKDFVSSIKDIEHHFTKAAESGHEVSRMLETKKIKFSISSEMIGKSSASQYLSVLHPACCKGGNKGEHGTIPHMAKVIRWNRSISSRSSSSRNPLTSASKDDCGESCSDFIEEFSMISGSHSSTLDRLYAWERKLYDEVKASESIRKAYDRKCAQLRHQFAKDMKAQVIDKTRATVKDLHSRVRVAIQAVDSISRRVEKMRDEELQPQLLELIQGLIRMWKAMLECHHTQHITISLAYHMKTSTASQQSEAYKQAITQLQNETECFASSFVDWVDAQRSYVEALNSWLQKCILQPQERSWRRRPVPFSPRRALAPPIFVLAGDWLTGINTLPSKEVTDSLKEVVSELHDLFEQQREEKHEDTKLEVVGLNGEPERDHNQNAEDKDVGGGNFVRLQTSLMKLFDQLAKYSEASARVYENVKQETEQATEAYINGGRYRHR